MSVKKILAAFVACSIVLNVMATAGPADSLMQIIRSPKTDTNKVNALQQMALMHSRADLDSSIYFGKQALSFSKEIKWRKGEGFSHHILGVFFYMKAEYENSLDNSNKAIKIWNELAHSSDSKLASFGKLYIAKTSVNAANVFIDQGNYKKALDYDYTSLKTAEEIGDKKLQTIVSGNIANVYRSVSEIDKAIEWYNKALTLGAELDDKWVILNQMNNLANAYEQKGDYETALKLYRENLSVAKEEGIMQNVSGLYGNIAKYHTRNMQYDSAIWYNKQGLSIANELGDKRLVLYHQVNLGLIYRKTGRFKEAEYMLLNALNLANETGAVTYTRDVEDNLGNLYDTIGKPALALEHYKNYVSIRDSINAEENKKETFRSEVNYEYEKKELEAKALQEKKDAIAEEEKQRQKLVLLFVIAGAVIIAVFSFFLFQRFRITRKQKTLIEEQKLELEEHQKEIIDSITYAKRLQEAILPPEAFIKRHIPENFVLYMPKDIVAGDFYWSEYYEDENNEVFFIAAADSTGHGVPGAMVSVVCSNALNRALKEFRITDPGKILDKARDLVLETFEKSDAEVKDGMDVSLLCIDLKNQVIKWSGANNPLWYIVNDDPKEIKANKQPVGKTEVPAPFTTHVIEYKKGSIFYLFTDGFPDQFGGPNGKKFKYKPFAELLQANCGKPCEEQKQILEKTFINWKGQLEQVDDVCVIGVRL